MDFTISYEKLFISSQTEDTEKAALENWNTLATKLVITSFQTAKFALKLIFLQQLNTHVTIPWNLEE